MKITYIPTHYIFDGAWECQHEGLEIDTTTQMGWNSLTGEYDDYEVSIEVCPSCEGWSNGEEWFNDK